VLPVEPTRGPRIPGPVGAAPGMGNAAGPAAAQNRRVNAVKSNHPSRENLLGAPVPKMGEFFFTYNS